MSKARNEQSKKKILRDLFRVQERAQAAARRLEQARAMERAGIDPADKDALALHDKYMQDAHNQQIVARRLSDRATKRAAAYIAAHPEEQPA